MRRMTGLALVLVVLPPVYMSAVSLDGDDQFLVSWSLTGRRPADEITVQLEVNTTGWVGLGFSTSGKMSGADIVVAWLDVNGEAHIADRSASQNSFPPRDKSQDVELISASESDGKTFVSFKRQINTCDGDSDRVIQSDTMKLLYAYGLTDPTGNSFSSGDYHSPDHRGARSVYLLDADTTSIPLPNDTMTYDMAVTDYMVPHLTNTTYYCSFHPAPELDVKHHVVAIEPLVTTGNEGLVHHMVLYACWNTSAEHIRSRGVTEGVCYTDEMPEFADYCRSIVFAWGVRGSTTYFPAEVGFALGDPNGSSPDYFQLETHYSNPSLLPEQLDSSGLRLHYTPILRTFDLGTVQIGAVDGIFVPPETESFSVVGYCHNTCTQDFVPAGGITVVGYLLYTHLLGASITVDLYRNGIHKQIFARDRHYDFNYQENRFFPEPKVLYPGDSLKITCEMDSSMRSTTTYGGQDSGFEMCLAFLLYYPRQAISNCESVPSYTSNENDALYSKLDITPIKRGAYVVDYRASLSSMNWTDEKRTAAQQAVYETSHYSVCEKTNIHAYQSQFTLFTPLATPDRGDDSDADACGAGGGYVSGGWIQTPSPIYTLLLVSLLISAI